MNFRNVKPKNVPDLFSLKEKERNKKKVSKPLEIFNIPTCNFCGVKHQE